MRGHRTLVFLDDFDEPEVFGWFCSDCDKFEFGYETARYPGRAAKRHRMETEVILEAS